MLDAILNALPSAVGIAISPLPIIAFVLILMSKRAASNSVAFLIGWILALGVVGVIVLNIGISGDSGSDINVAAEWAKLAIGILFLIMAAGNWRKRPKPGQKPTMPKWMATIDRVKWPVALGLAVLLSALNPKNLGLALAGMADIAQSGLSSASQYGVLLIFVVISSLSLILPLAYFLIAGQSARGLLLKLKAWLTKYNAIIMTIVLLILGLKVTIQALGALLMDR